MEEKRLYPLTFCTIQDDYAWGSEEFKLADLGYRDSLVKSGWLAGNSIAEIMETYIERVVGDSTYNFYGRQFPVCVKKISVSGKMPLRVHPNDETAAERYDFLGKEKLWYVVKAGKNASVSIGFKKDTDASELYEKCLDNTVGDILNTIAPHAGQFFHIAPGTPHCAQGEMSIIEISESSPLDFCLCGWGETVSDEEFDPQLSLVEALDFINYGRYAASNALPDLPQLRIKKIELASTIKIHTEDTYALYVCVSGSAAIRMQVLNTEAEFRIACGEAVMVPAECSDFTVTALEKGTVVLSAGTSAEENDRYINPDAAPTLEDDGYASDGEDDEEDTLL